MEKTVGPYRLGDSLGALPFGELVAATHSARSETLALLLLDDRLAKDHRFRGLLRLEVARAGGLRHPAIARTIEVGEHDGALYVVVERPTDARTLAQALADGTALPRTDAVALIRALAAGLDAAHGRRLVHGALSPASVLLGSSGGAALVGIALLGAVEEAGLGAVVAERADAAYTAPEQQTGRRAVASADGYALGVLAAALLGVKAPPAGPADAVGSAIARQLSADPAARFPTCAAFAAALADAPAQPSQAGAGPAPPPPRITTPAEVDSAPAPVPPVAEPAPEPITPPWSQPAQRTDSAPVVSPAIDPLSPPPPAPEPVPSLPWDAPAPHAPVTASASPSVPAESPGMEPSRLLDPPASPAEPWAGESPSPPAAPDRAAAASGSWLQSVIDPPRPARPSAPPTPATHAADADVAIAELGLTPAMAELLRPEPPRDPIGDAVHMAADRVPAIEELVDRYSRDGKVGPLPLGVAVAGALAALLLLVGQFWPATVLIMVVVVLYGVPKLGAALTASERSNPRAARVTGTLRVKRPPDAIGAGSPELILPTGVTLGARASECDTLASFGHPVTVQRPAYQAAGVVDVVLYHELPGVTVTYITPNRILLDVRHPNGAVIYRRPPYRGEPGDRDWTPADGPLPGISATGAPSTEAPGAASHTLYQAARATPAPSPGPAAPANVTRLQIPSAARASLKKAAETAKWQAGAVVLVGLIATIVFTQWTGFFGFFVAFGVLSLALAVGGLTVSRALKLWGVPNQTTMVRVVGPVTLTKHRANKSHRYFVHLADGTKIQVDSGTHIELASAGQVSVEEAGFFDFDDVRHTPDGFLQAEHLIPSATTTYEPSAPLLLEVRGPSGDTIYRDRALKDGDLGPGEPAT